MSPRQAVWLAVRRGDRKGTVVSSDTVLARTGVRLAAADLSRLVDELVADGCLYWRGQQIHRRLLPGRDPDAAPAACDVEEAGLW